MPQHASIVQRNTRRVLPVLFFCLGEGAALAAVNSNTPGNAPPGEWQAFFSSRGAATAVLQPPERNHDKDWISLQFTAYTGPKIRLAVMNVENKTAVAEQANKTTAVAATAKLAEVPVPALLELLTTAVVNTHRFEVLERKAIEDLLAEQDLGASGRVTKPTAAATGKLTGVQYMLYAAVNEWTPEKNKTSGSGANSGKGMLGLLGVQQSSAELAMSFRIVDSSSSQVLFATTERATADSWGIGISGNQLGHLGGFGHSSASPIGYAVQACINKGVYKLAMWLKDRPWSGLVLRITGDKVYINAGSNDGITLGLELNALSRGVELIDPATGRSLGRETEQIGSLRVVDVREQYAITSVVEGCKTLKVGDQVELRSGISSRIVPGGRS